MAIDMPGVSATQKANPGGYVPLNGGNKNGSAVTNCIPAKRDYEIVTTLPAADPNLNKITISISPADAPGQVTLSSASTNGAAGRIRIWDTAKKDHEVTLPKTFNTSELPKDLYVEGIHESNAEREITLKVDWANGGAVLNSDSLKLSVTPIFVSMTATAAAGAAPDITKTARGDWILGSWMGGGGKETMTTKIVVINAGLTGGDIRLVQNVANANNQNGGSGATLSNGATKTYDFAAPSAGKAVMDADPADVPFYTPLDGSGSSQNGNQLSLTVTDSPLLPVGTILPPVGKVTTVDVSYTFTIFATWQFPKDAAGNTIAYFLGDGTWSVRYAGTINTPVGGGNPTFAAGANNGNTGGNGTASNKVPTTMGAPVANNANAAWR